MSLEQRGNSGATLNESVVHLARQPIPLGQYRLKTGVYLAHAEFVASPHRGCQQ